jgi:hypothetical protein
MASPFVTRTFTASGHESGHGTLPRAEEVRETLDSLDKYLGSDHRSHLLQKLNCAARRNMRGFRIADGTPPIPPLTKGVIEAPSV